MARFKVRYGRNGSRISRIKSTSIIEAKKKFKKLHPQARIDSVTLIR